MQNIELQNIRPQIRSYIKETNPAGQIAGFFYYSSGAILWTAGALGISAFLIGLLFSPGMTIGLSILGLIFGFPGWVWAGIGVFLFRGHKNYYRFGLKKDEAVLLWILTIAYNGAQAAYIFTYLNDAFAGNIIGGWNLIVAALAFLALYFELKKY